MWKKVYSSTSQQPDAIDTTSSKKWNYIRKDFVLIEGIEDIPEHWEFMEMKVLKSDWEIFMSVSNHDGALSDVYDALAELAEIVIGG